MQFVVGPDLLTMFDSGGVALTGEIRCTATSWHDGHSLDMTVQAVDDEDNTISDKGISSVRSKGNIFVSNMPKNLEAKVRFSFCPDGHRDL